MHLNAQRPVFVPEEFQREIEKLSKAALMDLVWDFAHQLAAADDLPAIMDRFRAGREIILTYRKQAREG